jgi:hypothetical protein
VADNVVYLPAGKLVGGGTEPATAVAGDRSDPLLLLVQLSSERTVEPVRQDSSFAEKQESHPALLLLVLSGRLRRDLQDARNHADAALVRVMASSRGCVEECAAIEVVAIMR